MRGSRVKNIVTELHGEKIDIVRHSEDIKEYIQASLSPAENSQMQLIADEKRVNIIVMKINCLWPSANMARMCAWPVNWSVGNWNIDSETVGRKTKNCRI